MRQRTLLTIIGAILVAIYLFVAIGGGWPGASQSFFANSCLRVGLVALAAAFAWPQLFPLWRKFPPWFLGTIVFALLLVLIRPRLIFVSLGLVVLVVAIHGGIRWLSHNVFRKQ